MENIKFRDLKPEEIEVRVGNIIKDKTTGEPTSFQLMLYKTARVDANILDETVGTFNWQKKYYQVKNTMVCSIGLYNESRKEWIWKDDGGDDDFTTEQVKAELSDSFKRAGFTIGIGRKLYTANKIYMVVDITKTTTPKSYFAVKVIDYDETSITRLVIINKRTKDVVIDYKGGKYEKDTTPTTDTQLDNEPITQEDKDYLTEYVRKLDGPSYNGFFDWLKAQTKKTKIAELTKLEGQKIVGFLKNRKGK